MAVLPLSTSTTLTVPASITTLQMGPASSTTFSRQLSQVLQVVDDRLLLDLEALSIRSGHHVLDDVGVGIGVGESYYGDIMCAYVCLCVPMCAYVCLCYVCLCVPMCAYVCLCVPI